MKIFTELPGRDFIRSCPAARHLLSLHVVHEWECTETWPSVLRHMLALLNTETRLQILGIHSNLSGLNKDSRPKCVGMQKLENMSSWNRAHYIYRLSLEPKYKPTETGRNHSFIPRVDIYLKWEEKNIKMRCSSGKRFSLCYTVYADWHEIPRCCVISSGCSPPTIHSSSLSRG